MAGSSFSDRAFTALVGLLAQHALSRAVHAVTRVRARFVRTALIGVFQRIYKVDLADAAPAPEDGYPSFNAFFTRALAPGRRPVQGDSLTLVSPADAVVSQAGAIQAGRIFQAKGHDFDVLELLGGQTDLASPFAGGRFATLYLSPRDYHRVHSPLDFELRTQVHVPGRLYSVNAATTRARPRLFARNERVVCYGETPAGPMAIVLVGALFVGSIETVWAGENTPPAGRRVVRREFPRGAEAVRIARGEELGRFNMGSTVIVLTGPNIAWNEPVVADATVRVGQTIGSICD